MRLIYHSTIRASVILQNIIQWFLFVNEFISMGNARECSRPRAHGISWRNSYIYSLNFM